jgi:hypothetical protein
MKQLVAKCLLNMGIGGLCLMIAQSPANASRRLSLNETPTTIERYSRCFNRKLGEPVKVGEPGKDCSTTPFIVMSGNRVICHARTAGKSILPFCRIAKR